MIQARKFNRPMFPMKPDDESTNATTMTTSHIESECPSEVGDHNDDSVSVVSESANDAAVEKPSPKKLGRPRKSDSAAAKPKKTPSRKQKLAEKDDDDDHDESDSEMATEDSLHNSSQNSVAGEYIDEDERLGPEELQKKIDKTTRQMNKRRDELTFVTNCVRVNDLGQDRHRRRYWHLAHAAGIYVEGLESAEPWKLPTEGLPHFFEDGRPPVQKKLKLDDDADDDSDDDDDDDDCDGDEDMEGGNEEVKMEVDEAVESKPAVVKTEEHESEEDRKENKPDDVEMSDVLKKLGSEIMVTPKAATKAEPSDLAKKYLPKVTPNGDKLNLFNHSSNFNMQLSPVRHSTYPWKY